MKRTCYLLLIWATGFTAYAQNKKDLSRWVNPFIGTDGHGHTYPGPSLPFGMMQLGPDTRLSGWDGCSGYHYSDSVVYGFSHTHLSGTGVPDYGDILFMPTVGKPQFKNSDYASTFKKANEKASAGFYQTYLEKYNIGVSLTTTLRAGMHQYTYPATAEANIIIDLTHRDEVLDSWVEIINDHEIRGFRRSKAWATDQPIYFYAKFNKPFKTYGIAINGEIQKGLSKVSGKNIKLYIQFNCPGKLLAKVGISAVSADGALKNLDAEIPGFDFTKTQKDAKTAWNKELSKIEVASKDENKLGIFYTALYHALLSPNLFMDVDGKYVGTDRKIHESADFTNYTVFSLWDTYRAEHPLLNLIDRKRSGDFIQTFLHQYQNGGLLPIWELAGNETFCMIGNHAIPVILDAYRKGISFDTELAFQAMKSALSRNQFGLDSYRNNGMVLADEESESVSKTLEYAYDDWCVAQMAKSLNHLQDYREFSQRSQYWKNVFDSQSGFMRARANGDWWKPFDPTEVNNNYTEANSWQYSFYVPQDISGLVKKLGGVDAFERKLDGLFTASDALSGRGQADITGLIGQYAHGNEPSHHMAYLYNFSDHPAKTAEYVQKIRKEQYHNAPNGLSGNEDCGQMSAWLIMSALGFYPVNPASNQYVLGTPWFSKSTIHLENGRSFSIEAPEYTDESIYLQDIRLNDQPYKKSFINYDDLKNGGVLTMLTGKLPSEIFMQELEKPELSHDGEAIITNPVIESKSISFAEKTEIKLTSNELNAAIYYTLDGSIPTEASKLYSTPFNLTKTSTVKAIALVNGKTSFPVSAQFYQVPGGKKVSMKNHYLKSYTGGGDYALVDGIRGKEDFRLGNLWQAYQNTDFEATIDLESIKDIKSIALGCLQDTRSWIIFPSQVIFWGSTDGINYHLLKEVKNLVSADDYHLQIKDFEADVVDKVRYIKILAKNYGDLPSWHAGFGEGGKAILFIDEITVK